MSHMDTLRWYMENIFSYGVEMAPCMSLALILFLLLRPFRVRRLSEKKLRSGRLREATLLFFWVFVAGLAALTLFPADFWSYMTDRILHPDTWRSRWNAMTPGDFYPELESLLTENHEFHNLFVPFQEIRRAMLGIPWLTFMLLGNILMFVPIGCFTALLWRGGGWWRSVLIGLMTSGGIEAVQFFIGRRTDIDDIILNTSGALLGYWIYCILRLLPGGVKGFQCYEEGRPEHGLPE